MPYDTTPRRIVIATFGSLGDLHPFLAIATDLRRRGHSVTVATAPHYEARIAALGFAFEPMGPPISPEDPALLHRLMRTVRGPEYLFRKLFLPHLADLYADLERVTAHADLLIASEVVFAAPILAEKTGIPWVSVLLSPVSFLSAHDPSVLPPLDRIQWLYKLPLAFQQGVLALTGAVMQNWAGPVQRFRKQLGLKPARNIFKTGKLSAGLVLAAFSKHFAQPQPDWPEHTVQTGFAFFDQAATDQPTEARRQTLQRMKDFLEEGDRPVIFTLGSAAVHAAGDFFHISAGAAHRLRIRAILISNRPDVQLLSAPNILVVPYADYATLFPHAAAIVHQGGIGTTAEALRAGIPSLVVPFNFDQPDNAARAVRLGVAIALPRRKYNRRHCYYSLHRILRDESMFHRAVALGETIRSEHGTTAAVDAIESFLTTTKTARS